ncbi:MAG TPA: GAF domain-containing protein [Gemmatimonadaceae bacterium]|nr:GAF domain-containing protein [Gemmatimonadaceae bacterium]
MPPRTLASLAHALQTAPDLDAALVALADGVAELDRMACLTLVSFDPRHALMRERAIATPDGVTRQTIDTTLDHLPARERTAVTAGAEFVDFADNSAEFARLLALPEIAEGGNLALKGLVFEGALSGILGVFEPRKIFGTRTTERIQPAVALFELAYARFLEGEARREAVSTLEDVTQRVHEEHARKLADLEQQLLKATGEFKALGPQGLTVGLERELAQAREDARRATRKSEAVEATIGSAVEQLEKAHVELHRRSEQVRQRTRTLYLIERVLTLDSSTDDPRELADGLLSLVGDDMNAERCSLLLRAPGAEELFLAAARGVAPEVPEGKRVSIGTGIAGRVAATREPLLVQEPADAKEHPLLQDEYFTTGSFLSFPLVYRDNLLGVVNLTNRRLAGVFVEDDLERVRLLGLVIALAATNARLPERLAEAMGG